MRQNKKFLYDAASRDKFASNDAYQLIAVEREFGRSLRECAIIFFYMPYPLINSKTFQSIYAIILGSETIYSDLSPLSGETGRSLMKPFCEYNR